jgi:hypothetical protein
MPVIEGVPQHDKEPQFNKKRYYFLLHHFPWRALDNQRKLIREMS